jgi:glucose/arabinose dehydrogenase
MGPIWVLLLQLRPNRGVDWLLLFACLRGQQLHRLLLDEAGETVTVSEKLYEEVYGRLRDVVEGPDGSLYILTSNRDGRGTPSPQDDRILRISPRF